MVCLKIQLYTVAMCMVLIAVNFVNPSVSILYMNIHIHSYTYITGYFTVNTTILFLLGKSSSKLTVLLFKKLILELLMVTLHV